MTTDDLPIDLAVAAQFVAALATDEALICWQVFDDVETRKDESLAGMKSMPFAPVAQWLADRNRAGCGIFATVQQTDGRGRVIANVTALRALFIDMDDGRPLPTAWPLPPSIIVQRDATHWHAYWCLVDGEAIDAFVPAMIRLAGHWQSDLKVCDLARVMRVPGFAHQKSGAKPVHLLAADGGRRYTIAQVLAAMPEPDWGALPEPYQRKAERFGIWKRPGAVPPPVRPQLPAGSDDEAWQIEMFRKWAGHKETGEGGTNPNGGRDAAAFTMACEGHGRQMPRQVIEEVVLDYLTRASFPNAEEAMRRIVRSACSQPRTGTRPVRGAPGRQAARIAGPRPGFALDDEQPPAPPVEPPVVDATPDPEPEKKWDGLNVDALHGNWQIGADGVMPIEWDGKREANVAKKNKRIGNLPIWPAQLGRDVATGRTFLRLGWITPAGEQRHDWMLEDDVKEGRNLLRLPEGPVAGNRWLAAAVWLTEARPAITQPMVDVTSRLGWCGVNGSRRWVWPGIGEASRASFIGDALPAHGTLDGWKAGLVHLLGLGEKGYTAMVCACFAAAAPWARLLNGQRNPVLGLQARSSSGKGSALDWALAMWGDASALRLPASSTGKGLQDRAIQYPDLPIFLDELQQLAEQNPIVASDAVYFLANGQRRVTSSRAQTSVGGEARHGVGFYAAEAPVLPGLNAGVQFRVIELTGDPCPDEATARILRQAGQHSGVLALAISERIQATPVTDWVESLRKASGELKSLHPGLEAGDGDALALLQRGADLLQQVCEEDVPTDTLVAWLAARIAAQRRSAVDRETMCLQQVLDWLLNLNWSHEESGAIVYRTEAALQAHLVAWSTWGPRTREGECLRASLECDPTHRELAMIFERYGGERRVLPAWAARGWIERQGRDLKVRRRGAGRVVRFSRTALIAHVGADDIADPCSDCSDSVPTPVGTPG